MKIPQTIPAARQRVKVKNHKGVFLVVWVDPQREVCDLVQLSEKGYLLEDVPFAHVQQEDGLPSSS